MAEEYESESDESVGVDEAEDFFISKGTMTWSGRQVKAWARFDITNDLKYSICLLRLY